MSKINTHFNMESVDYLANYASLLHFAYVYRTENSNNERFKNFFSGIMIIVKYHDLWKPIFVLFCLKTKL